MLIRLTYLATLAIRLGLGLGFKFYNWTIRQRLKTEEDIHIINADTLEHIVRKKYPYPLLSSTANLNDYDLGYMDDSFVYDVKFARHKITRRIYLLVKP